MDSRLQTDRDYHNVIAPEYDRVIVQPRWLSINTLFRNVDRYLPASRESMLDIGCGTGHMLVRYGSRFRRIVALDHSEGMLTVAKQNAAAAALRDVEFVVGEASDFLAGQSRKFDFCTCVGFLHHQRPEQLEAIFRAVRDILTGGGVFLLAEPVVATDPEPRMIEWWNRAYARHPEGMDFQIAEPDEAPLELDLLRNALRQAGFRIAYERRGWEIYPRSNPASAMDRAVIPILDAFTRDTGPVYCACCVTG